MKQPLISDLDFSAVAEDTAGAVAFLARGGDALRWLSRANVFCRVLLGRQLLVIQQRQLWRQMQRSVGDQQNAAHCAYRSWDDFMAHGFPQITGLSKKTGYAAVMLAKAAILQKLPESELRKFESLANTIQLVKLERKGVPMHQDLVVAAQTLPVEEFRQMTGCGKKAVVEAVVESREAARELQAIVSMVKAADPNAIAVLRQIFEEAMMQAGDNPTDAVDCIIAACREQWREEQEPDDSFTSQGQLEEAHVKPRPG